MKRKKHHFDASTLPTQQLKKELEDPTVGPMWLMALKMKSMSEMDYREREIYRFLLGKFQN